MHFINISLHINYNVYFPFISYSNHIRTQPLILLMSCITDNKQEVPHVFICSYEGCGRRFLAQFSLNRHNIIHSDKKRFSCKYCGKKFSLGQYLREHEYRHTKELPYECGVAGCTKRFRQAGKLSLHRKTHPEYVPKKYNYALNKEKRTKTKSLINSNKGLLQNFNKDQMESINPSNQIDLPEPIPTRITHPEEIDKGEVRVALPLIPGLYDTQERTIHSPSMRVHRQYNKVPNQQINEEILSKSFDSLMTLINKITGIQAQKEKLVKTHFSTLDLFSLVRNFKH